MAPSFRTLSFRRKDRSEVSVVIKYLVFGFNVIIWLFGITIFVVGIYAYAAKTMNSSFSDVIDQSVFDPVKFIIVCGTIIFIIGFFGCIGALRENTILLLLYIILLGLIFLGLLTAAIIVFAFQDWLENQVMIPLQNVIPQYRDDPDLQNLIDWVQGEWLLCCGLQGPTDWELNIYFNCSSPGVEACGVPFSCCLPSSELAIPNVQCGYQVNSPSYQSDPTTVIYTTGCIHAGDAWFKQYLIPIAGVVVAVAVLQIIGICLATNLRSDILAQKAKWYREM